MSWRKVPDEKGGGYEVRWRQGTRHRSRTFRSRDDAKAFDREQGEHVRRIELEAKTLARTIENEREKLEKMRAMIAGQGGDPRVLDDYTRLPTARGRRAVKAPHDGYLTSIDCSSSLLSWSLYNKTA